MRLGPNDPHYPPRLLALPDPVEITLEGTLPLERSIAVVGSRRPHPDAEAFAYELSRRVAKTGARVISGGALGIDAAAHRGALGSLGGTTVVAATGHGRVFPSEHASLFREVVARGGSMVWPFPPHTQATPMTFLKRNQILVALSDAVVVGQAAARSGALNAASWARRLGRPVYVVSPPAWLPGFGGSLRLIAQGARVLTTIDDFIKEVGLAPAVRTPAPPQGQLPLLPASPPAAPFSAGERALLSALVDAPTHLEVLADSAHLSLQEATSALLTLALENVVVEGPLGFYRRGSSA